MGDGFVAANAIKRVEADDNFFKEIVTKVSIDENWHIHAYAIGKIQDETYLNNYVKGKNEEELNSIIMNNYTFGEKLTHIAEKILNYKNRIL